MRGDLVRQLASTLGSLRTTHITRVAIDGIDAAGKSTLANELAMALRLLGRNVLRASIDGFHNPAHVRHRQGKLSPEGYYQDSFNYAELIEGLLKPLGPGGGGVYRDRVFDFRTDSAAGEPARVAPEEAVLLFDGVFLLRPELTTYWDFSIFLSVDFDEALRRAESRDLALFGSAEEVRERYRKRYIPGQKTYFDEARPQELASIVIDNNDVLQPFVLRST